MDFKTVDKPEDWPRNNRETNLDLILQAVENFKKEPSYKNKELLFSLIDITDLNEVDERGVVVFSEYETAVINKLYFEAQFLGCDSLKMYLYGYVTRRAREYKFIRRFAVLPDSSSIYIKEFLALGLPVRLFYLAYTIFNIEKEKDFAEYLIETVKDLFYYSGDDIKEKICASFTMLILDLGFANAVNVFPYLSFTREQIKKIFQLCAQMNRLTGFKVNESPLNGTLKIAIRQWILKSRNYNCGFIYKSISIKNILQVYSNNQIWMSETSKLNDKREQKVIRELFFEKNWLKYDWAKKIKINELQDSFVCSFSTSVPSKKMKEKYGGVILGYKSDRIASLIAPTTIYGKHPYIDQVAWYDIIYDRESAKDEINYLCDIINEFELCDAEKSMFLENILVYWYLSFKDKKWMSEKERRYQLFIFDYKKYVDAVKDNGFLKMDSSLYLYPDFIFTDDLKVKSVARLFRNNKTCKLMSQAYYFCNNCLQANRAVLGEEEEAVCPVCGSKDMTYHDN